MAVRFTPSNRARLGRAARSLTAGSARGLGTLHRGCQSGAGPMVRCAAQAQGCAVAQPRAPAGALARHVRNPDATRRSARGRPLVGRRPAV